jgi:hypothetical protein
VVTNGEFRMMVVLAHEKIDLGVEALDNRVYVGIMTYSSYWIEYAFFVRISICPNIFYYVRAFDRCYQYNSF